MTSMALLLALQLSPFTFYKFETQIADSSCLVTDGNNLFLLDSQTKSGLQVRKLHLYEGTRSIQVETASLLPNHRITLGQLITPQAAHKSIDELVKPIKVNAWRYLSDEPLVVHTSQNLFELKDTKITQLIEGVTEYDLIFRNKQTRRLCAIQEAASIGIRVKSTNAEGTQTSDFIPGSYPYVLTSCADVSADLDGEVRFLARLRKSNDVRLLCVNTSDWSIRQSYKVPELFKGPIYAPVIVEGLLVSHKGYSYILCKHGLLRI